MKRLFLALLSFASVYGFEQSGALVATVMPSENHGYFILADGTFWRVETFVKRWRSPLEWFSGSELQVPESYISTLSEWIYNDEFEIYPKYGNMRADESAASNQDALRSCTHMMVNPRTGKVLFALPLHPADFAAQVYNEGHAAGHAEGYAQGYSVGYLTAQSVEDAFDR